MLGKMSKKDAVRFNNSIYDIYRQELEYVYVRYIYATFIKQATIFDVDEYNNAVSKAIYNVKKTFPKYRKNRYFYCSIKGFYLVMFNRFLAKIIYKINNRNGEK